MRILAIIPARGGSKGVPGKNIRPLGGKPLITYSIEAANRSQLVTEIVVSTDDDDIAHTASETGTEVIMRPAELAGDESLVMDAVRHVLDEKKKAGSHFDLFVLLEPTAPFRTAEDIDQTIRLLLDTQADSAATFSETETPPTRIWKIEQNEPKPFIEGSDPFLPRQKQAIGYALNGMVYVMKTELLDSNPETSSFLIGKTAAHIIPREQVVDIDTEMDFIVAEQILKHKTNSIL